MPTPTTFRHGYSLGDGTHVGPFVIENSDVKHNTKQQYKRYELPTQIVLALPGSQKTRRSKRQPQAASSVCHDAEEAIKSHLEMGSREGKILYTEFGSPYECHCVDLTVTKQVIHSSVASHATLSCARALLNSGGHRTTASSLRSSRVSVCGGETCQRSGNKSTSPNSA